MSLLSAFLDSEYTPPPNTLIRTGVSLLNTALLEEAYRDKKIIVIDSLTGICETLNDPRPARMEYTIHAGFRDDFVGRIMCHNSIWDFDKDPEPMALPGRERVPAALASLSKPTPIPWQKQLLMLTVAPICREMTKGLFND